MEFHSKHEIVTEAYGSLAYVFYLLNNMELDKISFRSITTFPGGPVDAAVDKAAKRLGITPTQVIFLWVKAKGAVIVTSVKFFLFSYFNVGFSISDMDFH